MSEHITSPLVYLLVLTALVVLTGITVWAGFQDFGVLNDVIALGIAVIKATLVILFFMHVAHSARLTKITVVASVFWLLILLALTVSDYFTRDFLG